MNHNKIIGLFMGGIINDNTPTNIQLPVHGTCKLDELHYHDSWDWLKPVIDKIIGEVIGIKTIDECTQIEWRYYTCITRMYIGINIINAHADVLDFINFYNNFKIK